MAKNRIQDLTNHLFAALEALDGTNDDGMPQTQEQLDAALRRAAGVVGVSDAILRVADVRIKATRLEMEHGPMVGDKLVGITYERSTK